MFKFLNLFFFFYSCLANANSLEENLLLNLKNELNEHEFTGIVSIQRNDAEIFLFQSDKRITDSSVFWIGSVSKQFAAAAILSLVDKGLLQLDDNIFEILNPNNHLNLGKTPACSVRQVLQHTCGLRKKNACMHLDSNNPNDQESYIKCALALEREFEPGTSYSYSNIGYNLIGIVISRLSQMCAEQYLQQQFFNPLSMSHSGIDIKRNKYAWESLVPGEMYNGFFHMRSWPWLLQYPTLATHYGASGNIYSTAKDLHLWNKPLHNSSLISAPLYQELIKPALKEYSFGLVIKEKKNKDTYYWHNGSISPLGYSSFLGWLPKQKISIVLLSHRSHNTSLMTEFGIKAANIFVAPSDSEKPIGQLEFSSYISEAVTLFFPLSVILSFRYVYILAFSFIGSASLWTIRLASTLALCACALTLLYPIFRHEKIGVFLFCVTVFALVIILFRNRRKLFDFRFQSITFKSIQSDLISIAIFMYFLQAMVVLWFIVSVIFAGLFVFFYNRIDKTRSQQQII